MRIYLSGFMGSGKTTVGRELGRRLAWPFVDLDGEVEAAAGLSVREIFEQQGEAEFRRLEREALAATFERAPLVVAVGGGTLVDPGALAAARAHGRVVWLDAPFELLVRRIGPRGKLDRPLFRDEQQARALLLERTPAYRGSDLAVEVGAESTPAELVARILIELRLREAACTS